MLQHLRQQIEASVNVQQNILQDAQLLSDILSLGRGLAKALDEGRRVFLFGNGGSAAQAQHLAAEFVGKYRQHRRGLSVVALTTDGAILTAIANDYGADYVFSRQLQALAESKDIAIAISTSGGSKNVLHGIEVARSLNLLTVGLTGRSGGSLREQVDWCIPVPSDDTARIQEAHLLIGHLWAEIVEQVLFGQELFATKSVTSGGEAG